MTWAGWQKTITVHKRRLVLPGRYGQDGDSSLPPEAAEAACHGGTTPITGHRAATAAAAPAIAATASATTVPAAAGTTGSTPTSTSSTVTGSSTWVTAQPRHRVRRGRSRTRPSPDPRSTRSRAHPHGASTPPHPGQHISPAASRRPTKRSDTSTVSTAPPSATRGPPEPGATQGGRAVSCLDIGTVPPPTNQRKPDTPTPPRSESSTPPGACYIGIFKGAQQPPGHSSATTASRCDDRQEIA